MLILGRDRPIIVYRERLERVDQCRINLSRQRVHCFGGASTFFRRKIIAQMTNAL